MRIVESDTVVVLTGDHPMQPSVIASGVDHGGLSGLGDDDHTQYLLEDGSRNLSGDLEAEGNRLRHAGVVEVSPTAPTPVAVGMQWLDTSGGPGPPPGLAGRTVDTFTADTTLTAAHDVVLVDAASGAVTLTLPIGPLTGKQYDLSKIDTGGNPLTLDGNGKTINGSSTISTTVPDSSWTIVYSGTEWRII